eukprot:s277_g9.t1
MGTTTRASCIGSSTSIGRPCTRSHLHQCQSHLYQKQHHRKNSHQQERWDSRSAEKQPLQGLLLLQLLQPLQGLPLLLLLLVLLVLVLLVLLVLVLVLVLVDCEDPEVGHHHLHQHQHQHPFLAEAPPSPRAMAHPQLKNHIFHAAAGRPKTRRRHRRPQRRPNTWPVSRRSLFSPWSHCQPELPDSKKPEPATVSWPQTADFEYKAGAGHP